MLSQKFLVDWMKERKEKEKRWREEQAERDRKWRREDAALAKESMKTSLRVTLLAAFIGFAAALAAVALAKSLAM